MTRKRWLNNTKQIMSFADHMLQYQVCVAPNRPKCVIYPFQNASTDVNVNVLQMHCKQATNTSVAGYSSLEMRLETLLSNPYNRKLNADEGSINALTQ